MPLYTEGDSKIGNLTRRSSEFKSAYAVRKAAQLKQVEQFRQVLNSEVIDVVKNQVLKYLRYILESSYLIFLMDRDHGAVVFELRLKHDIHDTLDEKVFIKRVKANLKMF